MTARGLERFSIYFFLIIITMWGAVAGQEDYSKLAHSSRIYINTASSGVVITNVTKSFPCLIRLNNSNFPFFDSVKTGGADIRFSNSAGIHLPFQIERWINNAGSNDTAEIWVKTDSIIPNDSLQHIVFYWGNGSVADSSSSTAVFANSNGFSAVYHLAEDDKSGVGSANYYKDATGSHHGYDSIISNTDNAGYIGHGHKFGSKDAIPQFTIIDICVFSTGPHPHRM